MSALPNPPALNFPSFAGPAISGPALADSRIVIGGEGGASNISGILAAIRGASPESGALAGGLPWTWIIALAGAVGVALALVLSR